MTREEAIERLKYIHSCLDMTYTNEQERKSLIAVDIAIKALEQDPKQGQCKDCKYFEYDSVAKVDGIPLILAHEICSRWGDGCKTKEDGYCFLFEQKMESEG